MKCSAKASTAGPNRPVGETGESRKGTLSTSFISVRFNHRWHSNTTKLAMDLPWAAFAFQPMAAGRQRCAATDSSRGGRLLYPFSSVPSTKVRAEEKEACRWGRVGCTPIFGHLIVDLWEEWRSSLKRGLAVPRQEPFIQAATGRFLRGRPFQSQLLHSVRQDTEKIGFYAWLLFHAVSEWAAPKHETHSPC